MAECLPDGCAPRPEYHFVAAFLGLDRPGADGHAGLCLDGGSTTARLLTLRTAQTIRFVARALAASEVFVYAALAAGFSVWSPGAPRG